MSAIFDFASLLLVLLLLICVCAFVRDATKRRDPTTRQMTSWLDGHKHDVRGLPWKLARIGERLSPFVAAACVAMAVHLLMR